MVHQHQVNYIGLMEHGNVFLLYIGEIALKVVRHLDELPVDSYKENIQAQIQNTPNQKLTSPL